MKFPNVQYMIGVEGANGDVRFYVGATRTAALAAASNPPNYHYVRFDRGPIMLPNGQPAPKSPYKLKRDRVIEATNAAA